MMCQFSFGDTINLSTMSDHTSAEVRYALLLKLPDRHYINNGRYMGSLALTWDLDARSSFKDADKTLPDCGACRSSFPYMPKARALKFRLRSRGVDGGSTRAST